MREVENTIVYVPGAAAVAVGPGADVKVWLALNVSWRDIDPLGSIGQRAHDSHASILPRPAFEPIDVRTIKPYFGQPDRLAGDETGCNG